jgi:hypothetical protein
MISASEPIRHYSPVMVGCLLSPLLARTMIGSAADTAIRLKFYRYGHLVRLLGDGDA